VECKGREFLVVGAGISGLLVATRLQRSGAVVKVVEKGRGFGGRMATRRMDGARLDHGAQFLTVRTETFGKWVEEWVAQGVLREWFRRAPWDSSPEGHPRYCGVEGMTDVGKALGAGLDVDRSVRLESVERAEGRWLARSESGDSYESEFLILTPPLPQSLSLLGECLPPTDLEEMRRIDYEPSLTGLFVLDGPSGLPDPGGIKLDDPVVTWIGDNARKGISPGANAVTVHSTPAFARDYWDAPNEERLPLLQDAAGPHLQAAIRSAAIHRWRYNIPLKFWAKPFYWNAELALGLAGDAFGGPRIEGAALSGLALADHLGA